VLQLLQPQIKFARHRIIDVPPSASVSAVLDKKLPEEHDELSCDREPLDRIAHLATTHDVFSNVCSAKLAPHLMISGWPPCGALTVVTSVHHGRPVN